jgi:hypothetical protein
MSRADEYRRKAADCTKQATKSTAPIDSQQWLRLAEHWLKLAEAIDSEQEDG